jgi:S-formylglutathione hydrolase FrmB
MRTVGATTWLEGFGEWAWPGQTTPAPAVELGPAGWVPLLPRPLERPIAPPRRRTLARPLRLARLVLLIAVAAATYVVSSGALRHAPAPVTVPPVRVVPALDAPLASPASLLADEVTHSAPAFGVLEPALPVPRIEHTDRAGSAIARVTYPSQALGWRDSFLAYLPPGYARSPARRYPVIYLLHGDKQGAASFLRLGLEPTLDRLIARHEIPPMIAVMLQANGLPNNWRNTSGPRYEGYVSEVVSVAGRVLRTIGDRSARAIAGYSMGGFGAMNVALSHLRTFSVVESWEGFFNNLAPQLAADRPLLRRLPLYAFVYGGSSDEVADPGENSPWATSLELAGAQAQSAIYPGGHTFEPLQTHLAQMLTFAGRRLRG